MADEPSVTNGAAVADWRPYLNDDLKADPIVSNWSAKASEKDIPAVLKGYAHLSNRMGNAIHLPAKDAKPEEVTALRQKLYEAGVFTAPPGKPEDYGILKPEKLPEGVGWNDELGKELGTILHRHGVPKSVVPDLLALHMKTLGTTAPMLKVDREQALAKLKAEHGEKYDERVEMVKRLTSGLFQTPEEVAFFEETGLGDHPGFLSVLLRLAPLAMQDSAFLESVPRTGGELKPEEAKAEYARIIAGDPTHPMSEPFKRRDPKASAYIDELYRKAYGTEKVEIDKGIRVGA